MNAKLEIEVGNLDILEVYENLRKYYGIKNIKISTILKVEYDDISLDDFNELQDILKFEKIDISNEEIEYEEYLDAS